MVSPTSFSVSASAPAEWGLSLDRLCQRAGVVASNAWGTDEFFRIWAAADEELGDATAGLRFGAEGIARGHGVAAIVALHAPDFRRALAALSRYKRLTCPELVEVEVNADVVAVRYRWLQATTEVPRLLVDTVMASLRELARQGTAGRAAPVRLELARRPANSALLRAHFGCPVVFGAAHDAMVFDSDALDMPFVTSDGGAFSRVLSGLESQIAEGVGFSERVGAVRVAIARQLSDGHRPSARAIAQRLDTSTRTLQRRLGECGTNFQHQLEAVRRTTASRLLSNTNLDIVAISMLLGFVEPNSFARAFRGWENTSPARWRQHQAGVRA